MTRLHRSRAFRSFLYVHVRTICAVLIASLLGGLAVIYRLHSLAPALAPSERTFVTASANFHMILSNPTHLILKMLILSTHFIPVNPILAARLPSAAMALIALALFTYILHSWYGSRSTLFGFLIFLTSAWFLHIARFAGPDIDFLLATLALLAVHVGLYKHEEKPIMLYVWLFVNIAVLTVPGMIWFVALGLIWQAGPLTSSLHKNLPIWSLLLWLILAILGLATVGWAIYSIPNFWRLWLGLPNHFSSWHAPLLHAANTLIALFYRAPHNPELWLGNLPILDLFTSAMFIAGVVFYAKHWRASRTHLLLSYFFCGTCLIALNGGVSLSVLVPVVYLLIVGGIAYMLHAWLRVFPRNPIARTVGIGVVTLVLLLSCAYNLSQYFIAWPHNPETTTIYMSNESSHI